MDIPQYQVALSFAGEQRGYVEEVARHLQARSIAVFYDGFERTRLWGKNGIEVFQDVFERRAGYVVMFISEEYVRKSWPRLERKAALKRMAEEDREYVLPVRFDSTAVPDLPEHILYEEADKHTPASLATYIAEKLGVRQFAGKASDVPPPRMVSLTGEVVFDYSNHNGRYVIGYAPLEFETAWSKASNTAIYVYNDPDSINGVGLCPTVGAISEVRQARGLDYTSRYRTPAVGGIVVCRNTNGIYAAIHIRGIKATGDGDDRDELRYRYAIQGDGSDDFSEFMGI
ncbi:MAG: TIR domain-containing protein [Acidimicrobiaceae bacterium]|nr:TIR domain-containing protein [Acidimicrobiaceae bacterium]